MAHFLGLHALQALPLIALLLRGAVRRDQLQLSEREQRRTVAWASVAYIGLVGITFWQALRGHRLAGASTDAGAPDDLVS